ncbi:MAG: hypothetical protein IKN72_04995 [Clostridia bacterium]|nr:hypothetical protein [Clostridia bacterium]MBR3552729.1 hypothetical protein [Clostridia bacterium]
MSINLTAIFMAIYLFFSGLFYGNQPVKLEVQHCSLDDGVIVCEETESPYIPGWRQFNGFSVSLTYKNVGRPFKTNTHEAPVVTIYRIENGERKVVPYGSITTDDVPEPVLVRHGDVRTVWLDVSLSAVTQFYGRPENGTYSIEVSVYDSEHDAAITLVYEDILIIR